MATINPSLPSDGTTIDAADVNTPFNAILGEFNGNIDNDNIKSAANISGSKLADASIPGSKLDTTLAGGWLDLSDTPDTVTYNGNRSYDLVFNSNDLTDTVSEGMRLRLTRTVSAPTQCADLEASSSQYFNKTSPAAMTFTDDFAVSAWVKLESYGTMAVVSRYNGTSGWDLAVGSAGQVFLQGRNGGASNASYVGTYQSIPLNKWVHIAAQLDMSAFTATTTTSYIMIDGVDVPCSVTRSGTNPTALVQAGNLEVGSRNATDFFDGKIAQVAIFNAKVTQATMRTYMSQGLSGSETSLISAYSFSNSINDLNTTNANNLSAQNSAAATNVDSPFGSYLGGTLEYGIITKTAFSTNTTLTVQVPEGCAIPTSGGVSAVSYSTQSVPYLFPRDKGRWEIESIYLARTSNTGASTSTWYHANNTITAPIGAFEIGYKGHMLATGASVAYLSATVTLSDANNSETERKLTSKGTVVSAATVESNCHLNISTNKKFSSQTIQYLNFRPDVANVTAYFGANTGTAGFAPFIIFAEPAYL